MKRELSFNVGMLYELVLLVLAIVLGLLFRRAALADLHWSLKDALVGALAAIPPFLFFIWTLRSKLFTHHQHLLNSLLPVLFGRWSKLQVLMISICAGISEEALFRGAIQGSLSERIGTNLALLLASVLFGAAHPVSWTYAIIVVFIGAYLGLLWLSTGNLLTPMVTHAAYDFVALVYFLRFYRPAD